MNVVLLKNLHKKLKVEESLDYSILANLIEFLSVQFSSEDFYKYFATILKIFFDEELASLDFIVEWG